MCLDFDASYWFARATASSSGPKRSPVHTPEQARGLAEKIGLRPAVKLVGMMCYEGHIAGVGDVVPGNRLRTAMVRRMQRASYSELRERRAAAVEAVSAVAPLEFVNAGGTGDVERVADRARDDRDHGRVGLLRADAVRQLLGFTLEPAAMFALPVSRRPGPGIVTALGGGYLASGAGAKDRMPRPYLPEGLKLDPHEGAGEVQTPLIGAAADGLRIGDRVYFRHTKAGELCERFDRLYLVEGDRIVDEVPTYRGEGKTFL